MERLLDTLSGPEDLRKLEASELPRLAKEIREYIKEITAVTGGHIGSGMGVVELTLALHYLFDFKDRDHLIMDVGHQCYPHKILTGRRDEMLTIRQKQGLSGFPDPKESDYDRVKTGHGGTSLTTAIGMAVGLKNSNLDDGRKVVAMIGDGGLQEGVALEALNHAGTFGDLPLVIILNDNEHGIGPAVGSLVKYFSRLRSGPIYRTAKRTYKNWTDSIRVKHELAGKLAFEVADRFKTSIHGLLPEVEPGGLFSALGFFSYGPIDGHDFHTLLEALIACRTFRRPVVLHCITTKGKGYSYKQDRLGYHAGKPAKKITAHLPNEFSCQGKIAYTNYFLDEALNLARNDKRVVAITAAMAEGTGLVKFHEEFPDRCFDVGMAEQHAVGMAQGLALVGNKPICAIYSTFMQRSIDQIFQEISLIKAPVMLCLDRAGLVGPDGATHNGVFDIAYCRMFPDMVVMAPRDGSELVAMMRLANDFDGPTAIRYPRTGAPLAEMERPVVNELAIGQAELLEDGEDGCLFAYGAMVYPALDVAEIIRERHGLHLAVVNARFAKPLDGEMLAREFSRQEHIFTLEDHVLTGGFGAAVLEHANKEKMETLSLTVIAIEDQWIDHGQRVESLAMAGLDVPGLVKRIEETLLPHSSEAETKPGRIEVTLPVSSAS